MRAWVVGTSALIVCWAGVAPRQACAAVALELRPAAQTSRPGDLVDIGLYAVADGGVSEQLSALDVVLTWDPNVMELTQAIRAGSQNWMLFGLLPDSQLDGLNDSLSDGDALFQANSFSPATATTTGLAVATLRFRALQPGTTTVAVVAALGNFSSTKVYAFGGVGVDITGRLGSTEVTVETAVLTVFDLTFPAGRTGALIVSGEIVGEAFGVTVALELRPRSGAVGAMTFTTPTGPGDTDIVLLNDPWPGGGGTFQEFEADLTGSVMKNGAVMDNGTVVTEPVVFSLSLVSFGVEAAVDALGVWDAAFYEDALPGWEPLVPTTKQAGTITVVPLGDGDGDEAIGLHDYSELEACFSGAVGPVDPPAYSTGPGSRCAVYDFDDDGDIDEVDYAGFMGLLTGP